MMRFRTLEIRWHDSKPISTCDFQPVSFKKARPAATQEKNYASQSYRLATGGDDNHVRLWMVHPNMRPPVLLADVDASLSANAPRPPRVEYLATLSRHSAAVNVVRFSPNGDLIASAGDDGMIIIWAPSTSPPPATYGSDLTHDDLQHEKEYWKPRTTFRCTTMQVYDLAWSPAGEFIIAGSTDNTARVFATAEGKCVYEIAEHTHYVQGVAWDPLNEYIATQSSDRSMHIYRITTKPGGPFEVYAVGKNTRLPHRRHSRTPSTPGRPGMLRTESMASDAESSSALAMDFDDGQSTTSGGGGGGAPLTPALSVASTPSFAVPPPPVEASSRRSSFSSNAPGSPTATFGRYGRSPSPMPPLPAIRGLSTSSTSAAAALWASVKLYGDESYTNFFRRLTFSPDGGLLLTPAGQFEDPSVTLQSTKSGEDSTPSRGRRGHPSEGGNPPLSSSSSSVYIYSRANFARPPIAQLPGHKKASIAVRFSPILYDLRPGVLFSGSNSSPEKVSHSHSNNTFRGGDDPPSGVLTQGVEGSMDVDIVGHVTTTTTTTTRHAPLLTPQRTPAHSAIVTPTARPGGLTTSNILASSPTLSPLDLRPPTPAASKPSTPVPFQLQTPQSQNQPVGVQHGTLQTASLFTLPYRLFFAVATMDTVTIYDTQQASPICLLTKLHYDEFTDMSWSPDGQCLILSSRDGYCTLVIFDDIVPAYHTQQHALQLQYIAQHHSVPLTYSTSSGHHHSSSSSGSISHVTPAATPVSSYVGLPFQTPSSSSSSNSVTAGSQPPPPPPPSNPRKRDPPMTPAASQDGSDNVFGDVLGQSLSDAQTSDPPKKKRRVVLKRVGDLES